MHRSFYQTPDLPKKQPNQATGKKIRLSFDGQSQSAVLAMGTATLEAGGFDQTRDGLPPIGATMPDGTKYAGMSPDTEKPMYVAPMDAPGTMTWQGAKDYAASLNAQHYLGHDDWRVPSKGELKELFNNRAAIGVFNISGSDTEGWYWSASENHGWWLAWEQRFSDGSQSNGNKDDRVSVRCVR